ncbi:MAG: hypothetical protein F6K10_20255 [Moorea sp. SIO2B7]|nr:hypothetical protein [Moorena sp. SIO2B7]
MTSAISSATPAIAQPIGPCVLDPADIGVPCTRDINRCGNPREPNTVR